MDTFTQATTTAAPASLGRYGHSAYFIKRQFMKLLGSALRVYGPSGELLLYVEQKAFKLKEDIRVYADEQKTTELLSIRARQIIDFSATYDIVDTPSGQTVGSLRRKGMKSILRDEWEVCSPSGAVVATVVEDSVALALVRRLLTALVPQNYDMLMNGQRVVDLKQRFNPFLYHMDVVFFVDPSRVDRRMGLCAAILLALIEGRQN